MSLLLSFLSCLLLYWERREGQFFFSHFTIIVTCYVPCPFLFFVASSSISFPSLPSFLAFFCIEREESVFSHFSIKVLLCSLPSLILQSLQWCHSPSSSLVSLVKFERGGRINFLHCIIAASFFPLVSAPSVLFSITSSNSNPLSSLLSSRSRGGESGNFCHVINVILLSLFFFSLSSLCFPSSLEW